MNTTRQTVRHPVALGEILAAITQTLPDDGHHPLHPHPGPITTPPVPLAPPAPAVPATRSVQDAPAYALFIAIDWADDHHDICAFDPVTQQRTPQTIAHDPTALHAWLADLHQRYPGQRIAVALEQKTGSLLNLLIEDDQLDLYPLNPAMVAKYRRAFHPSGTKTDPTDAALILDLLTLHRDKLTVLRPNDPLTRQLQILTRKRRDAVNLRTQVSNRLKDLLKQYFPLFLQVCGEDLFAPMACRLLLDYPSFDTLKQANPDTLRSFYVTHGSWKPAVIAHRLQLIRDAEPLTTDAAIIQPSVLEATMLADLLLTVGEHITAFDRAIADLFPQHPDANIFTSLPGAGAVFAPRLLAAFGADRARFATAAQVQNTAGISPVTAASGTMRVVHWRPACSKFLRQTFQEYANESIRHSLWARAYYQIQRDRSKRHQAAIRALAFKWIRVIFACWQAHQPYNELRDMKALQQHHAPLLEYLSKSDEVFGKPHTPSTPEKRRNQTM
jgi:transposase